MRYLDVVSRILLATIFVVSGFSKVMNFQAITAMSAGAGIPAPEFAIALAAALEIGGGLALAIGWQPRWASLGLLLFLIPTTLLFHGLAIADPARRQMELVQVLKNLAIMGGLLQVYTGAGQGGLARAREHAPETGYLRKAS